MSVAITEAMTTLAEAEQRFHLSRMETEDFFLEWCHDLPELTNVEETALTELRRRYMYQRSQGQLLDNTVTLLFASPIFLVQESYVRGFHKIAYRSVTDIGLYDRG
ncbi:MAG: hypothetical protein AAGA75_06725 [Cyanobacteria bacterium P01_E01_bin.6]